MSKRPYFDVAYRLRVGNYRVLFDREDVLKIIGVIDVLPRQRAYRRRKWTMLDNVQIIKENDQPKFAVILFEDYVTLKELLSDPERLADYLDYLHMQQVKQRDSQRYSLDEVKDQLELDV